MSKEENYVYEFTHKVMMQIVDEQDKAFCGLIQEDITAHPDKYKDIELKVVGRDRIKELLTLGLNAEKQLAELKAENERLKESNTSYLVRLFDYENKKLKQQLKEKDEEIAEMKELDKATCESLYASRELFEKEKVKRWKLEKQLQSNTKQVCEKIREKTDGLWYFVLDEQKEHFEGNRYVLSRKDFDDILNLIEKGESDD